MIQQIRPTMHGPEDIPCHVKDYKSWNCIQHFNTNCVRLLHQNIIVRGNHNHTPQWAVGGQHKKYPEKPPLCYLNPLKLNNGPRK